MKLKLLFVAVLISASVFGQNVPSYVPTNGLVGWWPFSGNANDESGNGNNGTVNGATLTADRFGNSNSAFSFNGNGNKITCNPISNTQAITISIWNYVVTGGGGEMCVQNNPQNCTNVSFDFQVGPTNQLVGIAHNGINCSQIGANLNTASNYIISSVMGSWNHYVGVIMSSGNSYLYTNGVLVDSSLNNLGFNSCPITNSSLRFGGPWWNGDNQWFSGKLDDIGIWNRALTQQEITALYQSQQTQCLPAYVPTSGLVGWWPFCGNANDESGNGNNGSVNGATLTTDRYGLPNEAYMFDGVSNGIITPDINFPYGNSDRTLSVWINNMSTGVNCGIPIRYGSHSPSNAFWINHNVNCNPNYPAGSFIADFYNVFVIADSTGVLPNSQWGMVTVSILNQICTIYLNDIQVGQGLVSINTTPSSNNFYIGSDLASIPNYFFNGKIDDIGIWNRALTQQEIASLYNGSATSISEITASSSIAIYPNPTFDVLNVKSDAKDLGSSYRIIDVTGRTISTGNITSESMTLDVGNYVSGMYLLVIGEGRDSFKIFKN